MVREERRKNRVLEQLAWRKRRNRVTRRVPRRIIWRSRRRACACSVLGLRGGGVVLTLRVLKASHGALGLGARREDGLHRCGALLVKGCV